jgi:hypothetical protein
MLRRHLIEFHCEIESQEQCSWAEAFSSSIMTGPLGPWILMGFVQIPTPHWADAEICSEIAFRSSWLAPLLPSGRDL